VGWQVDHAETRRHLEHYIRRLELPTDRLRVTTDRRIFETWLGRRMRAAVGGAYTFEPRSGNHLILINLSRINQALSRSLEVVVAEELVHMRDRLDGDLRRHAKHGHDRIATKVADLTGATLEEIRAATIPPLRRPARFVYACPGCGATVSRRNRGRWSCGRCAPAFDSRFVLQLVTASGSA
jgi:predicted SprT family Zn-dependent metalloprotease